MYIPWKPVERALGPHPDLSWNVTGRTLTLDRLQGFGPQLRLEIVFDNGLAGFVAVDESAYQSTGGFGLALPEMLDRSGFSPLPWPAWKEEDTSRAQMYGDLGTICYKSMDSYWFFGTDQCRTML
jgi:hypothetical protein